MACRQVIPTVARLRGQSLALEKSQVQTSCLLSAWQMCACHICLSLSLFSLCAHIWHPARFNSNCSSLSNSPFSTPASGDGSLPSTPVVVTNCRIHLAINHLLPGDISLVMDEAPFTLSYVTSLVMILCGLSRKQGQVSFVSGIPQVP